MGGRIPQGAGKAESRRLSIVTKKGDGGETSLLFGGRVRKDDPRAEAYGTVDEVVAALSLAHGLESDPARRQAIEELETELFTVAAELATTPDHRADLEKHFDIVDEAMVERLSARVAELESRVNLPKSFVLLGNTPVSGALNLARAVVRRAERRAVTLMDSGKLENREVIKYLNRCSDYVFMMACDAEHGAITPKRRSSLQR